MTPWPPELPEWSPWPRLPARWHKQGRLFARCPDLLVIHSGSTGPDVAGYLARINLDRKVSAHFSSRTPDGDFHQQVSLHRQAWHAGGSVFAGKGSVNARSWGIELPGPWHQDPRPDALRDAVRALVGYLVEVADGRLRWWTRHSDIKATKMDPGPGFWGEWLDGLGLEWRK